MCFTEHISYFICIRLSTKSVCELRCYLHINVVVLSPRGKGNTHTQKHQKGPNTVSIHSEYAINRSIAAKEKCDTTDGDYQKKCIKVLWLDVYDVQFFYCSAFFRLGPLIICMPFVFRLCSKCSACFSLHLFLAAN